MYFLEFLRLVWSIWKCSDSSALAQYLSSVWHPLLQSGNYLNHWEISAGSVTRRNKMSLPVKVSFPSQTDCSVECFLCIAGD